MSRPVLPDRDIRHIEDLAASGFKIEEIANDFLFSPLQFRKLRERDPRIDQAIQRGEKRFEIMSDEERRRRLSKEDLRFIPSPDDLENIQQLATLGWAQLKIAENFGVTPRNWNEAKKKFPRLAEALRIGYAESGGARVQNQIDAWMPTPEDLVLIEDLAYKGLQLTSISAKMGLPSVNTLRKKADDVPEIREAFELGRARLLAECEEKQAEEAKGGNFQSRFFTLKTQDRNNWSERPPTAAEMKGDAKTGKAKKFIPPSILPRKEQEKEAAKLRKAHLKLVEAQNDKKQAGETS